MFHHSSKDFLCSRWYSRGNASRCNQHRKYTFRQCICLCLHKAYLRYHSQILHPWRQIVDCELLARSSFSLAIVRDSDSSNPFACWSRVQNFCMDSDCSDLCRSRIGIRWNRLGKRTRKSSPGLYILPRFDRVSRHTRRYPRRNPCPNILRYSCNGSRRPGRCTVPRVDIGRCSRWCSSCSSSLWNHSCSDIWDQTNRIELMIEKN